MKYIFCLAIVLFFKVNGFSQSYGLTFNSHEAVLEKRTGLDLSPGGSLPFKKDFELAFDIKFIANHEIYFGYIVRIINNTTQNIDLIYDQRSTFFKVIIGENFSGISFHIDSLRLYKEWNRFSLKFDLDESTLQFYVNGKQVGNSNIPPVAGNSFKFLWGANDFQKFKTRDLPPMQLKDIRIFEQRKSEYFWPLDETTGDVSSDKTGGKTARIRNPVWIKPQHQKWELAASFTIPGYAGLAYDSKQDKLYVTGSDALAVYSMKNEQNTVDWLPHHHQDLLLGHQAVYDIINSKLYDIFIDQKKVVPFDFTRKRWAVDFSPSPLTEYWHANKFISFADTSLYVIGGYGQLQYKNLVQSYHFATKKWEIIRVSGDYFSPRYLSALGADSQGNFAYIIGGYGSQTGDQMLDPKNYYDLYRYNIKGRIFKKLFTLKPLTTQFTFANSLVVGPEPGKYYGLIFPNDSFNSNLLLIEGSLTDSTYRVLGNAIPYNFLDVRSFADLYYSPLNNKLIAVTLFYSKDGAKEKSTDVKIYTLNFPPDELISTSQPAPEKAHFAYFVIFSFAAVLICILIFFMVRKNKRNRLAKTMTFPMDKPDVLPQDQDIQDLTEDEMNDFPALTGMPQGLVEKKHRSSIYLFGQFQVFDKTGNDITGLFTPLLKELFLVIAIYTMRNGRGISSEGLNEILWHDKSEKDAKNNRSVNLAKLKTIFEKIGNCTINKESGYWQFQIIDESMFFDYKKYVSILQEVPAGNKEYIHSLTEIIRRGVFLYQTDYNWLDNIKSEISNSIIDLCLDFIKNQHIHKSPEFIIEITNCIFYFDQLNEDALTYQCKSLIFLKRFSLANHTYLNFVKNYKDIYGEDFGKSFQELIA